MTEQKNEHPLVEGKMLLLRLLVQKFNSTLQYADDRTINKSAKSSAKLT
jgi:hypothetical protein